MLELTPMEHDNALNNMGKWSLLLNDIKDIMHSQKHKTQTSHEHVKKPKHFHWQLIHDNELEHLMTTCPLST